MPLSFGTIGNIPLSVYNHLNTNLVASGIGSNGISGTFIYGSLDDDQVKKIKFRDESYDVSLHNVMPIITLEDVPLQFSRIEMGSQDQKIRQQFLASIFATDPMERMKLVNQVIFNIDQKSITHSDYSANPDSPSSLGFLKVDHNSIRAFPVRLTNNTAVNSRIFSNRTDVVFSVSNK